MNYSIINDRLKELKMTKSQLREQIGFSTATLSKISSNKDVSLDVMKKICDYLELDIKLILDNDNGKDWKDIIKDEYYNVRIWYRIENDHQLVFLFGYCIKSIASVEERDNWDIEVNNERGIICFYQTISAEKLQKLLLSMEQEDSIYDYFYKNGFKIEKKLKKKKLNGEKISIDILKNKILTFQIKRFTSKLLYPKSKYDNTKQKNCGQPSFCNSICICDGIEVLDKMQYAEIIKEYGIDYFRHFFKEIVGLYFSDNDIAKLGNFEIYNVIDDSIFETNLCIKEKNIKLKFFPERIEKFKFNNRLIIIFIGYYNNAEVIDKCYEIYIDENNFEQIINLPEEIDEYEIKTYTDIEKDLMLVGYKKEHVVKSVMLSMNIINKEIMFKNSKGKEKKLSSFISNPISIGEINSQRNFKNFINSFDTSSVIEDYYYIRNDKQSVAGYNSWINDKAKNTNPDEIWLFDPYLNDDSLDCIFNIADKYNIPINLVTTKNKKYNEGSLNEKLNELNEKCGFAYKLFLLNEKKFHDRFVFFKNNKSVVCYCISNSMDDATTDYGTYVSRVSDEKCDMIWKHYQELVANKEPKVERCEKQKSNSYDHINNCVIKFETFEQIKEYIEDSTPLSNTVFEMIFNDEVLGNTAKKTNYISVSNYRNGDYESVYDYYQYLFYHIDRFTNKNESIIIERMLNSNFDDFKRIIHSINDNKNVFDRLLVYVAHVLKYPYVNSSRFYIKKLLLIGNEMIDLLCYSYIIYNFNEDCVYEKNHETNIDIILKHLSECKNDDVVLQVYKNISLAFIFKINIISGKNNENSIEKIQNYNNIIYDITILFKKIIFERNIEMDFNKLEFLTKGMIDINCNITIKNIIVTLYNENVINNDVLLEFYRHNIFKKFGIDQYKNNKYFFSGSENERLDIMLSILKEDINEEIIDEILTECNKKQKIILVLLNDYFLREREHSVWVSNINSLFYLEFAVRYIETHFNGIYKKYENDNLIIRNKEQIKDIVNQHQSYLDKYCDIYKSLIVNFGND